jgi:GNAT superfamily N-acetyltransferase
MGRYPHRTFRLPVDREQVRALFDREMRREPHAEEGYRVDRNGSVVRLLGREDHCVLYSRFRPEEAAAGVAEQTAEFRSWGLPVEWKVYSHDEPPELPRRLAEVGYAAKPRETLMVFDLSAPLESPSLPPGSEIRRLRADPELADFERVERAAFGREGTFSRKFLEGRLENPDLAAFVAYERGLPVAAGRVERVPGRSFAGIWGGGTVPEARRQGYYRGLVAERAAFARDRGARYLMVEALVDTSRPILEKIGFVALADVVGWELAMPGASGGPA